MTSSEMSPADIAAVTNNNGGGFGGFGNGDGAWWLVLLFLFAGWGRGFGGGGSCGSNSTCATPADVRSAVDQQTLISKLDNAVYGLADSTYAINNAITGGFHGVDTALCSLGYNLQGTLNGISREIGDCCCATQGAIRDVGFGIERATMQNRFDAQTYNCSTLSAIDKLGDRIINYMSNEKTQALRDENFGLKLAASQAALVNQLRPCPVPAYITCNPYAASYGNGGYSTGGCGCGCG